MHKVIEMGVRTSLELAQRLESHPVVKARMLRLLDVMENASGDIRRASDAERCAIDELRAMGQEVIQGWGTNLAEKEAQALQASGGVVRQGKKNSTGSAHSVKSKS